MRGCIVVVALAAACSGGSKATVAQTPAGVDRSPPSRTATDGAPRLAIGEATVVELGPPERPVFRLKATGEMESLWTSRAHPEGEWVGGAILREDGTMLHDGEPMATIVAHGVISRGDENNRTSLTVDGNSIVIKFPPQLTDIKVDLADDGNVTLTGDRRIGMGTRYRIDAADPIVRRTMFILFTTTLPAKFD